MICEVCAKPLTASEAKIVSPKDMRIIADNGFGQRQPIHGPVLLEERRVSFRNLARERKTDWTICGSCFEARNNYLHQSQWENLTGNELNRLTRDAFAPLKAALNAPGSETSDGIAEGRADLGVHAEPLTAPVAPTSSRLRDGGKAASDDPPAEPDAESDQRTLQDELQALLPSDHCLCPSCGAEIFYAVAVARAASASLRGVPLEQTAQRSEEAVLAISRRLHKIVKDGRFDANMTYAKVDPFDCPSCNAHLSLSRAFHGEYDQKPKGASVPARGSTRAPTPASMICDVCARPFDGAAVTIVSPGEMRVIAQNGFGEAAPIYASLPLADRRSKFHLLAFADNTDWAICGDCYRASRPYAYDANPGGLRPEDTDLMHEMLRPLIGAMGPGGGPTGQVARSTAARPSAASQSSAGRPKGQSRSAPEPSRGFGRLLAVLAVVGVVIGGIVLLSHPAPATNSEPDDAAANAAAAASPADDMQAAQTAMAAYDYATALNDFKQADSPQPNLNAEYMVGWIYEKGWRQHPPDLASAQVWYDKAANLDVTKLSPDDAGWAAAAQSQLGALYETGWHDVPASEPTALYWFEKAAKNHNPLGALGAGEIYAGKEEAGHDDTIELDFDKALALLTQAAGAPDDYAKTPAVLVAESRAHAEYLLGNLYADNDAPDVPTNADGVREPDLDKARMWMTEAAGSGSVKWSEPAQMWLDTNPAQ